MFDFQVKVVWRSSTWHFSLFICLLFHIWFLPPYKVHKFLLLNNSSQSFFKICLFLFPIKLREIHISVWGMMLFSAFKIIKSLFTFVKSFIQVLQILFVYIILWSFFCNSKILKNFFYLADLFVTEHFIFQNFGVDCLNKVCLWIIVIQLILHLIYYLWVK